MGDTAESSAAQPQAPLPGEDGLVTVILGAFPTPAFFARTFCYGSGGVQIAQVTKPAPHPESVRAGVRYVLLKDAESSGQGILERFLRRALKDAPGNPALRDFIRENYQIVP